MVEPQPSKLTTGVRFSSPAPLRLILAHLYGDCEFFIYINKFIVFDIMGFFLMLGIDLQINLYSFLQISLCNIFANYFIQVGIYKSHMFFYIWPFNLINPFPFLHSLQSLSLFLFCYFDILSLMSLLLKCLISLVMTYYKHTRH